jgi:hypothetical protein
MAGLESHIAHANTYPNGWEASCYEECGLCLMCAHESRVKFRSMRSLVIWEILTYVDVVSHLFPLGHFHRPHGRLRGLNSLEARVWERTSGPSIFD